MAVEFLSTDVAEVEANGGVDVTGCRKTYSSNSSVVGIMAGSFSASVLPLLATKRIPYCGRLRFLVERSFSGLLLLFQPNISSISSGASSGTSSLSDSFSSTISKFWINVCSIWVCNLIDNCCSVSKSLSQDRSKSRIKSMVRRI